MGAGSPRGPVARVRMFRERHRVSGAPGGRRHAPAPRRAWWAVVGLVAAARGERISAGLLLLTRIYEVFPLRYRLCGADMWIIALVTEAWLWTRTRSSSSQVA